ncbi:MULTISPECIES: MFS transporter [unclassified Luteococcus]|uniref:MFS transporter n=1 Tax=unclassified Luteococcus TaxID=2639923 RepID=UPI00313B0B27
MSQTTQQSTAKEPSTTDRISRDPSQPVPTRQRRPEWLAFLAATLALVTAFVASAAPLPLYNTYRAQNGVTTADLSLTVVAYFLGTIGALLCLGRLSTHLGRKPVTIATLILVMAGCLVLLRVDSVLPLVAGRFLMGVGCGMASSAVMAFVVDAAPPEPPWLATLITSQGPNVGLTLGAFGSGALVDLGPAPRTTVFITMAALLAVSLVLVLLAPETHPRTPGARASLRPQVALPRQARRLMPVAAMSFMATWALGAAYQSLGPSITQDYLHTDKALGMALVFASYMVPGVLGAPFGSRFLPATAQRIGISGFLVGAVGLWASLLGGSMVGFMLFGALAGCCQGITVTSAIRGLMHGVAPADRASVLAAIYLTCYLGAMVPNLVIGQLTKLFSLPQVMTGFVAMAVVAAVITWLWARNPDGLAA